MSKMTKQKKYIIAMLVAFLPMIGVGIYQGMGGEVSALALIPVLILGAGGSSYAYGLRASS